MMIFIICFSLIILKVSNNMQNNSELASISTPAGLLHYTGTTTLQNVTEQNASSNLEELNNQKRDQAGIGAYNSEEENEKRKPKLAEDQIHQIDDQQEEDEKDVDSTSNQQQRAMGFLPSVIDNKMRVRSQRKDWQDTGPLQQSKLPAYMVAEDKFASNYLAGLKRQKRLKKYLKVVYHTSKNVAHLQGIEATRYFKKLPTQYTQSNRQQSNATVGSNDQSRYQKMTISPSQRLSQQNPSFKNMLSDQRISLEANQQYNHFSDQKVKPTKNFGQILSVLDEQQMQQQLRLRATASQFSAIKSGTADENLKRHNSHKSTLNQSSQGGDATTAQPLGYRVLSSAHTNKMRDIGQPLPGSSAVESRKTLLQQSNQSHPMSSEQLHKRLPSGKFHDKTTASKIVRGGLYHQPSSQIPHIPSQSNSYQKNLIGSAHATSTSNFQSSSQNKNRKLLLHQHQTGANQHAKSNILKPILNSSKSHRKLLPIGGAVDDHSARPSTLKQYQQQTDHYNQDARGHLTERNALRTSELHPDDSNQQINNQKQLQSDQSNTALTPISTVKGPGLQSETLSIRSALVKPFNMPVVSQQLHITHQNKINKESNATNTSSTTIIQKQRKQSNSSNSHLQYQNRTSARLSRQQAVNDSVAKRSKQEIEAETQDLNAQAITVLNYLNKLESLWSSASPIKLPACHKIVFLNSVKILDMHTMAYIFAKEVEDFEGLKSPVIECITQIVKREQCLAEIYTLDSQLLALEATTQGFESHQPNAAQNIVDRIELKLKELRSVSIACVELIVLWRDHFRHLAMISASKKKKRSLRKQRAQNAIQSPFLIDSGTFGINMSQTDEDQGPKMISYLIKMKMDVASFASRPMNKYFNFVAENSARQDPFLITSSMTQTINPQPAPLKPRIVQHPALLQTQGSRIIKNLTKQQSFLSKQQSEQKLPKVTSAKANLQKQQQILKRLIAFVDEDEYHKAKACDEMLLYEKLGELKSVDEMNSAAEQTLLDFKRSLQHYIKETTLSQNSVNQTIQIQDPKREFYQEQATQNEGVLNDSIQSHFDKIQQQLNRQVDSKQSKYSKYTTLASQQNTGEGTRENQSQEEKIKKNFTGELTEQAKNENQEDEGKIFIQDEQTKLELQALRIGPTEFTGFCENYFKKLLPGLRNSCYRPDELYQLMESGYERHYMKIVAFDSNGRKMAHGLACVNVDPISCQQGVKKAFLRHLSVIRIELLPQAFRLIIDFIWRRIECDYISYEQFLTVHLETGKLLADGYLKQALQKTNFKQEMHKNYQESGRNSLLLQLSRSEEAPAYENIRGLTLGQEPITIKAGMIAKIQESQEISNEPLTVQQVQSDIIAPLQLLSCLSEFKKIQQKQSKQVINYTDLNRELYLYENYQKQLEIADRLNDDQFKITTTLREQGMNLTIDSSSGEQAQNNSYISSMTDLTLKLPAFDHFNIQGKAYLKIKSNELIVVNAQANDEIVVIIPVIDNPKLKIYIIPDSEIQNQSQLLYVSQKIKDVSEIISQYGAKNFKELYLPCFNLQSQASQQAGLPRLTDSKKIEKTVSEVTIQTIYGKAQDEGLLQSRDEFDEFAMRERGAYKIEKSFYFVIQDEKIIDQVDGIPLFVAKVNCDDFLGYPE